MRGGEGVTNEYAVRYKWDDEQCYSWRIFKTSAKAKEMVEGCKQSGITDVEIIEGEWR